MFQKQPLLNAKGLLTAVVATLLTGQALAETAGRVTFVTGEVVAISSDGQRRVLAKSELVNRGERLETGKGRLQIRFTDGSFVSLQPNTVFGLDNYTFARAKPKEGALLFNFIRGGMRTISGTIGKINRANYTVKTPVGTIGIRGTGYVATQEPNGRLLITVNKGIVNVSNEFGSSNINVGQTFQIEKDKAPEPAQQGVAAEVLANKPVPKTQDSDEEEKQIERQPEDISFGLANDANNPDFGTGEQTNADGQPNATIFPFVVQSVDGVPHLSSFGSLLKGSSGKAVYSNVLAAYNNVSADGKTVGNLVGLISTKGTTGISEGQLLLDTRRTNTPLQFSGVKQIRSLSFGEWTNGQAASIDNFINITGLNLSATQFMPYIVGSTTSKDLGNNQRISYSLANTGNATPARAANSVGQLTKLNISIDLNLVPLVDIDMAVTLDNTNYTASLQNKAINLSLDKKLTSFVLNGSNDNFFASSNDTNGKICANNSCPVTLSAFFSGTDMGAVYEIARANNLATIGGVAALSASNPTAITLPKNRLPSTLDNSYTALFSNNAGINITPNPITQLAAVFDTTTGGWRTGFHTQTANGVTSAIDVYGVTTGADGQGKQASAATISQVNHLDNTLSWGVWSNGLVDVNDPVQNYALSGTQQIHYIVGAPTTVANIPLTRATHAVYTFQGGTTPTLNTAGFTGSIANSSYLDIDFGSNKTTLNLDMTLLQGTSAYLLNATGKTNLSRTVTNAGMFNFDNLSVTLGAGNPCNTLGCTASASGFLAGSSANLAGLNYSINAVSPTLNNGLFITTEGVAAFKLDPNATIPVSTLANATEATYRALLTKQINDNPEISVSHAKASQVSASFDPDTLVWKTGTTPQDEGSASRTFGLVGDTVAVSSSTEVRHYKQTLSWGRWLNSSVNYGDANASVKLAANDNVHYIIGVPAASLPSSGIATYRFVGSTTPTGTLSTPTKEGSPASTLSVVTGVSVLNDSKVTVNFSKPTSGIGLDLGLSTLANGDIRMTGNANLSPEFRFTNLAVTTGTTAATACSTCSANGFFAGANASMIGLNYEAKANIAGGNASISGVAAFEK